MTDLEISKALALAIGWPAEDITDNLDPPQVFTPLVGWRVFDYRDWDVIGPIAARYDCFPFQLRVGIWCTDNFGYHYEATPQKAIAMAVIGAAKK